MPLTSRDLFLQSDVEHFADLGTKGRPLNRQTTWAGGFWHRTLTIMPAISKYIHSRP